jgi:HAD superfamily hydrolase (TIGR01549 family)
MIRCVLFDLDGTLVDTWDLYVEAYIRTLEPYFGHRLTLGELIALQPTSEWRLLGRALADRDVAPAHREFLSYYRALHANCFGGVYPGVREMLKALRAASLRVGIVTGKSRGGWEITAHAADLGDFAVVVTDEDVAEGKPDPEGLVVALNRLQIPGGESVYVGDSVGDAKAAKAAGTLFAAALWPKAAHELERFLTQVREVGVWRELAKPESLIHALQAARNRTGRAPGPNRPRA